MVDLLKLFQREDPDDPRTRLSEAPDGADIESELRNLILEELGRGGIPPPCLTVDVRSMGHAPDGRNVYQAMVRVAAWDPAVVRLLLGLPLLQAKVRRTVRSSWLHDVCHFNGLWLHPSSQLEDAAVMGQLREALLRLEHSMRGAPPSAGDLSATSVWSVPPELDSGGQDEHSGHVPL